MSSSELSFLDALTLLQNQELAFRTAIENDVLARYSQVQPIVHILFAAHRRWVALHPKSEPTSPPAVGAQAKQEEEEEIARQRRQNEEAAAKEREEELERQQEVRRQRELELERERERALAVEEAAAKRKRAEEEAAAAAAGSSEAEAAAERLRQQQQQQEVEEQLKQQRQATAVKGLATVALLAAVTVASESLAKAEAAAAEAAARQKAAQEAAEAAAAVATAKAAAEAADTEERNRKELEEKAAAEAAEAARLAKIAEEEAEAEKARQAAEAAAAASQPMDILVTDASNLDHTAGVPAISLENSTSPPGSLHPSTNDLAGSFEGISGRRVSDSELSEAPPFEDENADDPEAVEIEQEHRRERTKFRNDEVAARASVESKERQAWRGILQVKREFQEMLAHRARVEAFTEACRVRKMQRWARRFVVPLQKLREIRRRKRRAVIDAVELETFGRESEALELEDHRSQESNLQFHAFVIQRGISVLLWYRAAAIKIQATWKMFIARTRYYWIREIIDELQTVEREQDLNRKWIERDENLERTTFLNTEQTAVRQHFQYSEAKRVTSQLRREKLAATCIQKLWKGHTTRKLAKVLREQRRQKLATRIQSAFRGYVGRQHTKQVRIEVEEATRAKMEAMCRLQAEKERQDASIKIQRVFRGYLSRLDNPSPNEPVWRTCEREWRAGRRRIVLEEQEEFTDLMRANRHLIEDITGQPYEEFLLMMRRRLSYALKQSLRDCIDAALTGPEIRTFADMIFSLSLAESNRRRKVVQTEMAERMRLVEDMLKKAKGARGLELRNRIQNALEAKSSLAIQKTFRGHAIRKKLPLVELRSEKEVIQSLENVERKSIEREEMYLRAEFITIVQKLLATTRKSLSSSIAAALTHALVNRECDAYTRAWTRLNRFVANDGPVEAWSPLSPCLDVPVDLTNSPTKSVVVRSPTQFRRNLSPMKAKRPTEDAPVTPNGLNSVNFMRESPSPPPPRATTVGGIEVSRLASTFPGGAAAATRSSAGVKLPPIGPNTTRIPFDLPVKKGSLIRGIPRTIFASIAQAATTLPPSATVATAGRSSTFSGRAAAPAILPAE